MENITPVQQLCRNFTESAINSSTEAGKLQHQARNLNITAGTALYVLSRLSCFFLLIDLSIFLSIYRSIYQSIYGTIDQSIIHSIYVSIYLFIYPYKHLSVCLSVDPSIYQSVMCLLPTRLTLSWGVFATK